MNMNGTNNPPIFQPLYMQIKSVLTESLIAGEWKPGESLPSEMQLADRYGVSQGTVRKAIDALAKENIVIRRQGKGTFVSTHKEEKSKLRFLRLTSADGSKELLENKLLECNRIKVNSDIHKLTGLKMGTTVIEIKRLLTFSQRPVILDYIIIEAKHFRGLNAAKINENNGSLYSMYETLYNLPMVGADEKLTAVMASAEEAKLLNITPGYPLLRIERIAHTYGERPIEWRVGLCVTDEHHYRNELE
jgi:GntR family transcriptional regulator